MNYCLFFLSICSSISILNLLFTCFSPYFFLSPFTRRIKVLPVWGDSLEEKQYVTYFLNVEQKQSKITVFTLLFLLLSAIISFILLAHQAHSHTLAHSVVYARGTKVGITEVEKEVGRSSATWSTQGGVVQPTRRTLWSPGLCLQEVCQAVPKSIF